MISAFKTEKDISLGAQFKFPAWATARTARPRRDTHNLKLEAVTTVSDFLKMEQDWTSLFEQTSKSHQFFQNFNWLAHWCQAYLEADDNPSNMTLAIVTGRVNGDLVMVWPLIGRRVAGVRIVEWMGHPVSQYGDVLVAESNHATAWLEAGFAYIKSNIKPDAIVLSNVRNDSQFATLRPDGLVSSLRSQQAPYLDLSQHKSFADFRAAYSTRTRKTRSRKRRRFMEEKRASRNIFEQGTCSPELTGDILSLKRQWLDGRNSASRALSNENFDDFMTRVVTCQNTPVKSLVTALSIEGKTVAGEIGFRHQNRYLSHVAAYDLETARLSPGVLQFEDTIEWCFENGIDTVDLLAPADPYKMEWATDVVAVEDLAAACTLKGYIAVGLKSDWLRNLLRKAAVALPSSLRTQLARLAAKYL